MTKRSTKPYFETRSSNSPIREYFVMGKPAARVGDMHTCPLVSGTVPHVGGPVAPPGCKTVLVGGPPAACAGDKAICTGPPDTIVQGSPTVFIGGKPACRLGDVTAHGGVIVGGTPTVLIGDASVAPQQIISSLPASALRTLPTFSKAYLGEQITAGKLSIADKSALKKLYKSITIADLQPASELQKKRNLRNSLKRDKIIKNARKNWSNISDSQRKNALQRAADLHAEAFGLPKKPLVFRDLGSRADYGYFSSQNGSVVISDHVDSTLGVSILDDSSEAFDTVIHENTHRYQTKLISDMNAGTIQPGDDTYHQAGLLMTNDKYYVVPQEDYTCYRSQPMEAQAWDIGSSAR